VAINFKSRGSRQFRGREVMGWFFPKEGEWYAKFVREKRVRTMAEVGVHSGLSTSYMLEAVPPAVLYAVDSWDESVQEHRDAKATFLEITRGDAKCDVRPMHMPSVDAAEMIGDRTLDMVFVDAGHGYKDVSADLRAWYGKVKPGGWLAGHDYAGWFPGVIHAVDEFCALQGLELQRGPGSTWFARKPVLKMTLMATTTCSGGCVPCIVREWMEGSPNHHMSLAEVDRFIDYSKQSGYHYRVITLCGGEPLMWKYIAAGVKRLKESGLTDQVDILTAVLPFTEKTTRKYAPVLEMADLVRISEYSGNKAQVAAVRKAFPKAGKYGEAKHIVISEREQRVNGPVVPVPKSLPAHCNCAKFTLREGKVDICPNGRNTALHLGRDYDNFPQFHDTLRPHFLNRLLQQDRLKQPFCSMCLSNRKVAVAMRPKVVKEFFGKK